MKIAICLTGQMRTAIYAFHNIKNFLGDLINSADFFIHTWDINSEKSVWGDKIFLRKEFSISIWELEEYINLYKPKMHIIEQASVIAAGTAPEYFKMHSLIKSIQLKQEYEISNGFTYDVVIKLRPDMIVDPSISICSILNQLDVVDNILFANAVIRDTPDDALWVANSATMDTISKYPLLVTSGEYYGVHFAYYLTCQTIKSSPFGGEMTFNFQVISDKWSIMRTESAPYHSFSEYKKCLEIDRNMYWNPKSTVAPFMKYLTEEEWRTIIKNMLHHKGFIPRHLEYLK